MTHHNDEAYAGALAVLLAMKFIGSSKPGQLISDVAASLPDCRVRDRLVEISSFSGAQVGDVAERFGQTGYVVESVPLAIFAAQQGSSGSFEDVLNALVASGGDTDTNASICGQILGCLVGSESLPRHLVEALPGAEDLQIAASAFAKWVVHREEQPLD